MNERLGALCVALGAAEAGLDLTRLSPGYLRDLFEYEQLCAEQAEDDDLSDALEDYE